MIPAANTAKVKLPAMGRNASAACEEVWMSVMPVAFKVAAVAKMMKIATTLDIVMPTTVSVRMRATCASRSAIAANPFITFFTVATESGKFDFEWIGDRGFTETASAAISVE